MIDSKNPKHYEVYFRKQGADKFSIFCPQLNIMFKDNDDSKIRLKMKKYLINYTNSLELDERDKKIAEKKVLEEISTKEKIINEFTHEISSETISKEESKKYNISTDEEISEKIENNINKIDSSAISENRDLSNFEGQLLDENTMI